MMKMGRVCKWTRLWQPFLLQLAFWAGDWVPRFAPVDTARKREMDTGKEADLESLRIHMGLGVVLGVGLGLGVP